MISSAFCKVAKNANFCIYLKKGMPIQHELSLKSLSSLQIKSKIAVECLD